MKRIIFKEQFKDKALEICNNEEDLANIVIELCYKKNSSKQFAWDISRKQIIRNLLSKNNYTLKYPALDENGDIEFGGFKFSMQEKVLERGLI